MVSVRFFLAAAYALLSAGASATPAHDATPATAEAPPLSLSAAVAHTLAHNPELAQSAFRLLAQDARVDAAGLRAAPELHTQIENAFGSGRARGLSGVEATFALSQVVELGGQRDRRLDVARESRAAAGIETAIGQLDVLAELGRRFIHVASDQKQLELTGVATELAGKTVTEVERRVRAAKSPEVELNRARISFARARVEQEHAEHELLTSRRKLAAMWGATEAGFGTVDADLFRLPMVGDLESLTDQLAASPDFLRYATAARQRDAEIRLAEAKARSQFTVSAGARWLADTDDAAFVGGISVPLFGHRQAQPRIAEARAVRAEVDVETRAARVRAEASLFELVQELRHAITEAEVLRDEVLPQMEAALVATEYAWQRGRYSYLEWTEAQRERIAVQRALIEAAANAHIFQVEIERLTGAAIPATESRTDAGVTP
ncbi:MAG: TolC family protein [Pseudomonadota bacterium]|nr:TolC family protein [Pseudomonadota bacterium]